jgi:hypothetical protein
MHSTIYPAHIVLLFLVAQGCHPAPVPETATQPTAAPSASAALSVQLSAPKPSPSPSVQYVVPAPEEIQLGVLADRTLVVQAPQWLATRTPDGRTYRAPLLPGDLTNLESAKEGIVVTHNDRETCTLLKTPSLETIMKGKCNVPMQNWGAVVFVSGSSAGTVAFQKNGTVFKFPIKDAKEGFIAIDPSESGRTMVLSRETWAHLVRTDTGAIVGTVPAPYEYSGSLEMGRVVGESLFTLAGETLAQYDMLTGALVRQMRVGCSPPAKVQSGSSMPPAAQGSFDISTSPNSLFVAGKDGARMALVCKNDLLVFGNWKLEGRIPRAVPGCDNTGLPGKMNADGRELVPMGCGGIARIDLAKRTYTCADNDGIAGGAYAMFPGVDTRAPQGRRSLPRCSKAPDGARVLDADGAVWIGSEEEQIVHSKTTSFALGKDAMSTVLLGASAQAPEIAYVLGQEIIVRGLDGKESLRWNLAQ